MQNNPSYKSEWRPGSQTMAGHAAKDQEPQPANASGVFPYLNVESLHVMATHR